MAHYGETYLESAKAASKRTDDDPDENQMSSTSDQEYLTEALEQNQLAWMIMIGIIILLTCLTAFICTMIARRYPEHFMMPGIFLFFLVSFSVICFLFEMIMNA
jgi:small-conductance mechanosensitive channel